MQISYAGLDLQRYFLLKLLVNECLFPSWKTSGCNKSVGNLYEVSTFQLPINKQLASIKEERMRGSISMFNTHNVRVANNVVLGGDGRTMSTS